MVETVVLADQIALAKRGGPSMPKYPTLTNQGKSLVDIAAVVFVVLCVAAAVAWFLTLGK